MQLAGAARALLRLPSVTALYRANVPPTPVLAK